MTAPQSEGGGKPSPPDSAAPPDRGEDATAQIVARLDRKRRARGRRTQSGWYGIGMFGLVGWAVAVPVVLGALLGLWIDRGGGAERSWTLPLILGGATLGSFNAWYWVTREGRDDRNDDE